ncbi:hypothetical protein BC826DRAFT_998614, partial [Russula brevipes]
MLHQTDAISRVAGSRSIPVPKGSDYSSVSAMHAVLAIAIACMMEVSTVGIWHIMAFFCVRFPRTSVQVIPILPRILHFVLAMDLHFFHSIFFCSML